MLSQATAEIIRLLEEEGEEHNTLQRVMMEFLKRELPNMLSVSVEKDYGWDRGKVTVSLKSSGEVISSDYFTIDDEQRGGY